MSSWGHLDIRLLGDRLLALSPDSPSPADDAEELRILDVDTLLGVPESSFGASGERWVFDRDDSGAVTSVISGGSTFLPAEEFRRVRRARSARRD